MINRAQAMLNSKWIDRILILLIIVYPLLFIWQGGDLTDTGLQAVNCQFFFTQLADGNAYAPALFADYVGGIWMRTFPHAGLLGFGLLGILFLYLSILLCYLMLRDMGSHRVLLTGLLCAWMFDLRDSAMIFGYDSVSQLFLILTAFCVGQCFKLHTLRWAFFAGIAAGLATIARIPNVLSFVLIPMAFALQQCLVSDRKNPKNIWIASVRQTAPFCAGFMLLIGVFFIVLKSQGALHAYMANLSAETNAVTTSSDTSYSITNIIIQYAKELKAFSPFVLCILSCGLALSYLHLFSRKRWIPHGAALVCLAVAFSVFYGNFSYPKAATQQSKVTEN